MTASRRVEFRLSCVTAGRWVAEQLTYPSSFASYSSGWHTGAVALVARRTGGGAGYLTKRHRLGSRPVPVSESHSSNGPNLFLCQLNTATSCYSAVRPSLHCLP